MSTQDENHEQFCLKWKTFPQSLSNQFKSLRDNDEFVDVTIACTGNLIGAHKLVLSACSPYFKHIFMSNPCQHPVLLMIDVEPKQIQSLLHFMYCGEVEIARNDLAQFLKIAENLQVRGLADGNKEAEENISQTNSSFNNINSQEEIPCQISENIASINLSHGDKSTEKCFYNLKEVNDGNNSYIDQSELKSAQNFESYENLAELMVPKIEYDNNDTTMAVENNCDDNAMNFSSDSMRASLSDTKINEDDIDLSCIIETFQKSVDQTNHIQKHSAINLQDTQESTRSPVQYQTDLLSLGNNSCLICGRVYSNRSNLKQHISLIHSPEEMTCPICQKTFRTKLYLRRHITSYHGEKIVFSSKKYDSRSGLIVQSRELSTMTDVRKHFGSVGIAVNGPIISKRIIRPSKKLEIM